MLLGVLLVGSRDCGTGMRRKHEIIIPHYAALSRNIHRLGNVPEPHQEPLEHRERCNTNEVAKAPDPTRSLHEQSSSTLTSALMRRGIGSYSPSV